MRCVFLNKRRFLVWDSTALLSFLYSVWKCGEGEPNSTALPPLLPKPWQAGGPNAPIKQGDRSAQLHGQPGPFPPRALDPPRTAFQVPPRGPGETSAPVTCRTGERGSSSSGVGPHPLQNTRSPPPRKTRISARSALPTNHLVPDSGGRHLPGHPEGCSWKPGGPERQARRTRARAAVGPAPTPPPHSPGP